MSNIVIKILRQPEKIIYGMEKLGLLDWMDERTYVELTYRLAFGRKICLNAPKAFTEKINWYKLNYRNPLMQVCADKFTVREYVAMKIGSRYLTKLYGIWDSVEEIDFSTLPNAFVLKPTNGSGDVVICKDKHVFNMDQAKKTLATNKKRHFSSKTKEWAYYNLPYRIMAEEYIESSDDAQIKDYKLFCFDGECKFLFVASDRGTENLKFNFFDTDWNCLPIRNAHDHNPNLKKPEHFADMLNVARKLSEDFPHVRVDLYEEHGKVYFGELTFYHFGGFTRFEPDEWDFKLGEYFDIQKLK